MPRKKKTIPPKAPKAPKLDLAAAAEREQTIFDRLTAATTPKRRRRTAKK